MAFAFSRSGWLLHALISTGTVVQATHFVGEVVFVTTTTTIDERLTTLCGRAVVPARDCSTARTHVSL